MADDAAVIDNRETDFPEWLTDPQGPLAPLGPQAVLLGGHRLRRWGLSEVWRLQLGGSAERSVIVKRGTGEMAREGLRYRELIVPLRITAPRLIAAQGGEGTEPVVLVLEDVGEQTLEQRPTPAGYREAVRTLARMRASATERLSANPALAAGLRRTAADFAETAQRAATGLGRLRPDLAGSLDTPAAALADRLDLLSGSPDTIVHGDFHAKNLVHGADGRISPVDWPGSYLHPHLGDLYCLLREARKLGLDRRVDAVGLPDLFARESGTDPASVRELLVTGGLCWTLIALRWVVEEGIGAVPESAEWIDELVGEARSLAQRSPEV